MAAQFPSKWDDGEIFNISSDILFSDQNTSKFNPHQFLDHPNLLQHQLRRRRHHLSSTDDLAHHFTVLSLLQRRNQNPKPPGHFSHNFERLNPPVRTGVVKPQLLPDCFRVNGNGCHGIEPGPRLHEYRTGLFSSHGSRPGYDLKFTILPTSAQLESHGKERASSRFLQGKQMQNRLLQQNRNMPFSGSGFEFKGGFARESGGTGVFHPHPRINNSNTTTSTATKKQSAGDRQEFQVIQQRKSTKGLPVVGTSKQNHLSSEISLPKEWTY